MNKTTVAEAIWTPWAQVLCAACNNAIPAAHTAAHHIPPNFVDADETRVTACDGCGCPVGSTDDEIPALHRIAKAMGGAMEQTGGMCAAAVATLADGRTVVVTALDGPDEWVVGVFAPGQWEETGDAVSQTIHDTAAEALLAAALAVGK